MIEEIKKYRTDIDRSYTFGTKEDAEKFEATFKPFYDLNREAEEERVRCGDDRMKKAQDLFDRAKPLLAAYVNENRMFDDNTKKELCGIAFCRTDIARVIGIFFHEDAKDCIMGRLFDTIFAIIVGW